MTRNSAAIGLAVLLASAAFAAPAAAAGDGSVSGSPVFVSQYMFRGERLGGPSFQPALEFNAGDLALGLWSNFPLADRVPGQSDPEIDPYAAYTLTVNDACSIVPGFTWYTFPNADRRRGFHSSRFEPNLALNYTAWGFRFTPKVYYDFARRGPTYEFSVAVAIPLTGLGTELDWTATVGTFLYRDAVNGAEPRVKNWGDYTLVGVTAPFALSQASRVFLGVAYTRGTGNYLKAGTAPKVPNPAAVGRVVVTLGYSYTF
jgi:uncharacterized protein (TIGR02001 family)